jgi:hypothetical protein
MFIQAANLLDRERLPCDLMFAETLEPIFLCTNRGHQYICIYI